MKNLYGVFCFKKGDDMKLADRLFYTIISIQEYLGRFENWYIKNKKNISRAYIMSIVFSFILILCKKTVIGETIGIFGIVFSGIENVIGWNKSVRKWLKICVIYNLYFSVVLACLIQSQINYAVLTPLFLGLYLLVWVFLSLISNSKVALLINEIVSGIATTIFTIGTYLIGIVLKRMPSSNYYKVLYHIDEAEILALKNGEELVWKTIEMMVLEKMEVAFISLLPIIGVTAFCIIVVKIKTYWMEKNNILDL